jgi:hypothetical protein
MGLTIRIRTELVQGNDGEFYGATSGAGEHSDAYAQKFGAVFKVSNDGSGYHELHNFSGPSGGEGRVPQALIEGSGPVGIGI